MTSNNNKNKNEYENKMTMTIVQQQYTFDSIYSEYDTIFTPSFMTFLCNLLMVLFSDRTLQM